MNAAQRDAEPVAWAAESPGAKAAKTKAIAASKAVNRRTKLLNRNPIQVGCRHFVAEFWQVRFPRANLLITTSFEAQNGHRPKFGGLRQRPPWLMHFRAHGATHQASHLRITRKSPIARASTIIPLPKKSLSLGGLTRGLFCHQAAGLRQKMSAWS
jgi:hypothetical protein